MSESLKVFSVVPVAFLSCAALAAAVEWHGEVAESSDYTDGANWTGSVAPTDGDIGVFSRLLGSVTVKFPAGGIRENSTTKVCLRAGTTESHAITFDLTEGGYWVKTYSGNYKNTGALYFNDYLEADSPIFGINNAAKISADTVFSITNSLIVWEGNRKSGLLTITGGELNFYDPEGLDVGTKVRPVLASGNSTYEPIALLVDGGAKIRVGEWVSRANGGNNLVRFSDGASLYVAKNLLINDSGAIGVGGYCDTDGNLKADLAGTNRFELIGASATVGGAVCMSMGGESRPHQRSELIVSNSTLTAALSFNPCGGVATNESAVFIGGNSTVSVSGVNLSWTDKSSTSGNRSHIEIGGESRFVTPGGNVLIGRGGGKGSEQRWLVKENGMFHVTAGSSGAFIGYNDTENGCATGMVELADKALFKIDTGDLSMGYTSTSGSVYGRLHLAGNSCLQLNAGGLIRVGRSSGCVGVLELEGGSIFARRIYQADGRGEFSADGGMFVSTSVTDANGAAISGLAVAELGAKGLVFSNDVNSVLNQAFADKEGADGLFVKKGKGVLAVLAESSHAVTQVRGGMIVLGENVASFGRKLSVASGASADFSAAGLEVDTLALEAGSSIKVALGKPIVISGNGGLELGGEITVSIDRVDTGNFTLFETPTAISDADMAKLKIVCGEADYYCTLTIDGNAVKLDVQCHPATEVSWAAESSGAWENADNWEGGVPYPNDTALFDDSAAVKDVVVASAAKVGKAEFYGAQSVYSLSGAGTLSGDLELSGGTLKLLSPSLVAPGAALNITGGTLEGDADNLRVERTQTAIASTYPALFRATKDMELSGAFEMSKGGLLKLGSARLALDIPSGEYSLSASGGATANLLDSPAPDQFGNMTGWGGCAAFNVLDGMLELTGAGSGLTSLSANRLFAVGSRSQPTASPTVMMRNISFSANSFYVSVYSTWSENFPSRLTLAGDANLSVASDFSLGYHDTQKGRSYLDITNSTLSVAGKCSIPESTTDFSGVATVTVGKGGKIVSTSPSGDAAKGIHLGRCRMRIEDGGLLDGGNLPITLDRCNKDNAGIVVASGGKIRTTAIVGMNTNFFTKTSEVIAGGTAIALDGGTVEFLASGVTQSANPDRNLFRLDDGGGVFEVGAGLTHRIAMPVTGAGALVKSGEGTLRIAKVVDRQADDAVSELADSAVQWTGGTRVVSGVLDLGGGVADLGVLSGGGTVSNGTVSCTISVSSDETSPIPEFADVVMSDVKVVFDIADGEPAVGESIPVARLGNGAVADLLKWRDTPRLKTVAAKFREQDGVVYADIVFKPKFRVIVR